MDDLFTYAERRRDDGMRRAVEHADAVEPTWSERAMGALLAYALVFDHPFMIEDVRTWATAVPPPPDGRAWGAVVQKAARAGTIVRVGYAPAKSSNLSPKCLWQAGQ